MSAKSTKGHISPKPRASQKSTQSTKVESIIEHLPPESPNSSSIIKPFKLKAAMIPVLNGLDATDAGNAEAFSILTEGRFLYCLSRRRWLEWKDGAWQVRLPMDKEGMYCAEAMRAVISTTRTRKLAAKYHSSETRVSQLKRIMDTAESTSKIKAVLAQAPMHVGTTIDEFDTDPFIVGTKNGILNLQTGEHRKAKPEDRVSMYLGVEYDKDAKCERWRRFQNEIYNNDTDLMSYVKRAIGYSITGLTIEQKIFFCFGDGRNGKSKMLKIIERLFGDYAGNAAFRTLDYEKRSQIGEDLASLKGKRFVSIIETPDDRRIDEARVKSLTGEDTIKCRFLYGNEFSYQPSYKIWMAMNHRPRIIGTDRGIWGRIQEIPFLVNFEGREDKMLEARLIEELPGILNWVIEGALEWGEKGLGKALAVERATEEYRIESDHLGKWLYECTVEDDAGQLSSNDAFDNYKQWAKDRSEHAFTQTTWGRMLSRMRFESTRACIGGRKVTVYKGLRIRKAGD